MSYMFTIHLIIKASVKLSYIENFMKIYIYVFIYDDTMNIVDYLLYNRFSSLPHDDTFLGTLKQLLMLQVKWVNKVSLNYCSTPLKSQSSRRHCIKPFATCSSLHLYLTVYIGNFCSCIFMCHHNLDFLAFKI